MSEHRKVIYFIGSELRVSKESLDSVKKIDGFENVYPALSGGNLPSDGYVAIFDIKTSDDVLKIGEKLSSIPGAEPAVVTGRGPVKFSDKERLKELMDFNASK